MVFDSFAQSHSVLLWSSFLIAVMLGAVVNKTSFCTMGAVSDMVNMGDLGRFRAWLLAIATAMFGVSILEYTGLVDASVTTPAYRDSTLLVAEYIIGGILFGIGMTLSSGCGNKTLVRIGGGNLKSVVVFLVIAVIAWYMMNPFPGSDQTLFSLLFYDWIRVLSVDLGSEQDIGAIINNNIGADSRHSIRLIAGLLIAAAILLFVFRQKASSIGRDNILAGIMVGAAVIGGWVVSNNIHIEADEEQYTLSSYYEEWELLADSDAGKPAAGRFLSSQSYTFISPTGQAYGLAANGFDTAYVTFGLVAVIGIMLGSLLWSLLTRSFRIEWFADTRDFINHVIGAMLMGFGGILSLGCTIGQGVTGLSTLAVGAVLTFFSIIFGGAITMKIQFYRLCYEDASFMQSLITALVDMKCLPESMRRLDAV